MSRGKEKEEKFSLRDKIKAYRAQLHGDVAIKFDTVFCEISGMTDEVSLKTALGKGKNKNALKDINETNKTKNIFFIVS